MTDIVLGLAASLAFFCLGWNIAGCLMGLATVGIFYWTARILGEQNETE